MEVFLIHVPAIEGIVSHIRYPLLITFLMNRVFKVKVHSKTPRRWVNMPFERYSIDFINSLFGQDNWRNLGWIGARWAIGLYKRG
jgi:hypothetical protein